MVDFNKKSVEKLIYMYKERPCLWKLNHESYSNKTIKHRKYEEIVEAFQEEYPDINSNIIKNKLQNLRTCYRKVNKKMEASEKSRTGVNDIYIPTLWYFNLLSFTRDQDCTLDSIYNLEDSQSSVDCEDQVSRESEKGHKQLQGNEKETEQFFKPCDPKKTRTKKIEKDQTACMKTCTTAINTPTTSTDDCAAFGTYVAEKLRKMDDTQQILAEALIQKVITKGHRKQLTDNTDLCETILVTVERRRSADLTEI